jgi:hypothetical protein
MPCSKQLTAHCTPSCRQVGPAAVPFRSFDNIGWSILSTYFIFSRENFQIIMYDAMRGTGPWAALFFVVAALVGTYLLFNIYLMLLLAGFTRKADKVVRRSKGDGDEQVGSCHVGWLPHGMAATWDGCHMGWLPHGMAATWDGCHMGWLPHEMAAPGSEAQPVGPGC